MAEMRDFGYSKKAGKVVVYWSDKLRMYVETQPTLGLDGVE